LILIRVQRESALLKFDTTRHSWTLDSYSKLRWERKIHRRSFLDSAKSASLVI